MKKISVVFLVMLTFTACKKKQDAADDEPAEVNATPECKDAGENIQSLLLQRTKADAPDEEKSAAFGRARKAGDAVAAACTKDKWSADAIACLKTAASIDGCNDKLTPAQRKALPAK